MLAVIAEDSNLQRELVSLVVIMAIAALAPIVLGLLRIKIAEVVLLLVGGMILGPSFLGWIVVDPSIDLVAQIGLGFLFFFAGLELDPAAIQGRFGKLAALGWGISLLLAGVASFTLEMLGYVDNFLGFAIVLTSTALGTLLPTFRDSGLLETPFGKLFMGAGAWGEFGPIVAIALFLGGLGVLGGSISLLAFGAIAFILAKAPRWLAHQRVVEIVGRTTLTSSQTGVRLAVLFMVILLALSGFMGLDVVLGAFIAGVILRRYLPPEDESPLQSKVEAVGFGFLIPVFFVVSGANIDARAVMENPLPMLVVFVLLLLVRGVPQFFVYKSAVPDPRARASLALYIATGLPIIVAATTVQVQAGLMTTGDAAELVGAGALSVLVFPVLAGLIRKRAVLPA